MSRMKKKQTYHQYDFEDVYGKEWKVIVTLSAFVAPT